MTESSRIGGRTKPLRLSCGFVDVTPEMAATWLSDNPNRRPLDAVRAAEYAAKMKAGTWTERERHETPITVTEGGTLINGQHRLSAVVLAGFPVRLRVAVYRLPQT